MTNESWGSWNILGDPEARSRRTYVGAACRRGALLAVAIITAACDPPTVKTNVSITPPPLAVASSPSPPVESPAPSPLPPARVEGLAGVDIDVLALSPSQIVALPFFVNLRVGYLAGYAGIFKTVDGGITWTAKSPGASLPAQDIFFADERTGYVSGMCANSTCGGFKTMLLTTRDGGEHWVAQPTPMDGESSVIHFVSRDRWIAKGTSWVRTTKDAGLHWELQTRVEREGLVGLDHLRFTVDGVGHGAGYEGGLSRTTDAGTTWSALTRPHTMHHYALDFPTNLVGYAGGQGPMIKTTDGGLTWSELAGSSAEIYGIHFVDADRGIAVGKGHYTGGCFGQSLAAIRLTRDGGRTWVSLDDSTAIGQLAGLHFPTPDTGYAVGREIVRLHLR